VRRKEQIRWARQFGSPRLKRLSRLSSGAPVLLFAGLGFALKTRQPTVMVIASVMCSITVSTFVKQLAIENPKDFPLPSTVSRSPAWPTLPKWPGVLLVAAITVSVVILVGPISDQAKALGNDPWWSLPFVVICLMALLASAALALLSDRRAPVVALFATVSGFIASFGDWNKSHQLVFKQLAIFTALGAIAALVWLVKPRGRPGQELTESN
jgi:hypothetical protein